MKTFVSDLRQAGGFLRVLRFPPPIKLTVRDIAEILLKVALNTIKQTNIFQELTISITMRKICMGNLSDYLYKWFFLTYE